MSLPEKEHQLRSSDTVKDQIIKANEHEALLSDQDSPIGKEFNYRPEYCKTALCVIAFVFSVFLNQLAISTAHDIVSRDALPDLIFSMIPQQDWALMLGDLACAISTVVAVLFLFVFHRYRFIIINRMFFTTTILYTFRAVCLSLTHIPTSFTDNHRKCIEPDHNASLETIFLRFFHLTYKMGLQVKDKNGRLLCGDLLFSGHTILVSTTTFYLNHYSPHSVWPLRWILIMLCVGGMICLSISRTHYSVDVIIGYWLSSFLFSIYHSFVLLPHNARVRCRAFRRLLIFWTMYIIEENVPSGRVPNELEWPFRWPKCLREFFVNWNSRKLDTLAGRVAEHLDAHRLRTHI